MRTAERRLIAVVVDGSGALDAERPPDTPTLERGSENTTEIGVCCVVRHSGMDAGIQGHRSNLSGVLAEGYRPWRWVPASCRDDGDRGSRRGPSFRHGCRNPGPGRAVVQRRRLESCGRRACLSWQRRG